MVKYTQNPFSKIRIFLGQKVFLPVKKNLTALYKGRFLSGKKYRLTKKSATILALNAFCLIGLLICVLVYHSIAGIFSSQTMAERWSGDSGNRYTQISCFLNNDATPDLNALFSFGNTIDAALLAASLEAPQGGLWACAYAAESLLTVKGDYGAAEVTVLGVGGKFFLFHPLVLRDGSYISDEDSMDDRVVLDEELAWKLFGSVDIAGLSVTINNVPYPIAGVVSREKDRFSLKTYTGGAGIFMSYAALAKLEDAPITCYEIVLPDPISGFGLTTVKDNFPLGDHDVALENTGRFSFARISRVLGDFGARTIQDSGVAYPYWENAARLAENQLVLLLLLGFAFPLFPAGCLIYVIIKEIRHVKHHFKKPHQDL